MADWTLKIGLDPRFASLKVTPVDPEGNEMGQFRLHLPQLLRELDVPASALGAMLEEAKQPLPSEDNYEDLCRTMLEATDWKGKTVLDIGGHNGWAAFYALERGASRAICVDNQQFASYEDEARWVGQRARERVEYYSLDAREWYSPADVVICFNVLYHVKDMWGFLEHLRTLVKPGGEMLLCTLFTYHKGAWTYLYEPYEANPTDRSTFWGPSLEALERLLTGTGWEFAREGLALDRVLYRCRPAALPDRWSRF